MLITTAGGSASNSYAAVDEIDSYLATTGYDITMWSAMGISAKERLAKIACRILDSFSYIGSTASEASRDYWDTDYTPQALKFPRNEDSQPIYGSANIPTEVKEAQAELVYFSANDYAQSNPNAPKIGELSVTGDFRARFTEGGNFISAVGAPARTIIFFLLKPYLKRGAVV